MTKAGRESGRLLSYQAPVCYHRVVKTNTYQITKFLKAHWLTVSFFLGFITDFLLLNQIDNLVDNLILFFYVTTATFSLWLFYVGAAKRGPRFLHHLFYRYAPLLMQYSFGGLLSGMLIFYGRSGDLIASFPFLLLIFLVILGNEFVAKRSDRLVYQLTLYFIGLFSYVVLVVPVLIGKMGDGIFIFSGLLALVLVTFVVQVLFRIVPNFMALNVKKVILSIGFVYILFNVLYFTALIPPIPLSLTKLEVVQKVDSFSNSSGLKTYRLVYEKQPWYRRLPFVDSVIHPVYGSVSCFARIYAPTKLSTKVYHRWEYQDTNGDWQTKQVIDYRIKGSNRKGYGGYTKIGKFWSGKWRCQVETERGQVLGRKEFRIDTDSKPKDLKVKVE